MKNKTFYTTIAYCLLALGLILLISGCKTKKTVIDLKQTETEQTETLITENKEQNTLITEREEKRETKSETEKSLFETDITIIADELTITDKRGNAYVFTNPKIDNKSKRSNNVTKSEQSITEAEKTTETEENTHTDYEEFTNKEKQSDLLEKHSSKGKEPFWLYVSVGSILLVFGYLILKRFRLI